jgi:hypothetical protein
MSYRQRPDKCKNSTATEFSVSFASEYANNLSPLLLHHVSWHISAASDLAAYRFGSKTVSPEEIEWWSSAIVWTLDLHHPYGVQGIEVPLGQHLGSCKLKGESLQFLPRPTLSMTRCIQKLGQHKLGCCRNSRIPEPGSVDSSNCTASVNRRTDRLHPEDASSYP